MAGRPQVTIQIPSDWTRLCKDNPAQAKQEQLRVRREFQQAFAAGLIAAAFERSAEKPRYLLYATEALED
jgi:predicted GNAT superfamily acetyltransferase